MRNQFPGYYQPTEDNFATLWNSGLFVVDANVLLNLYRYSSDTSNEILEILEIVSDRLWIPHQVAVEYQENRLAVIYKQEQAYDDIEKGLQKAESTAENDLRSFIKHPLVDTNDLIQRIQSLFNEIKTELSKQKENHPDWLEKDNIRDQVTALFDGKVGPPYPPERMNEIFKDGETRYNKGIPPGYLDNNKDEKRKYGDLVLWLQIIDKVTEAQEPIIFITDERKDDWWWHFKGKTLGPRPELVQEIMNKAGVLFYMYNTDSFMGYARGYLRKKIKEDAIEEVRRLKQFEFEESDRQLREQFEVLGKAASMAVPQEQLEALSRAASMAAVPYEQLEALRRAASMAVPYEQLEALSRAAASMAAVPYEQLEALRRAASMAVPYEQLEALSRAASMALPYEQLEALRRAALITPKKSEPHDLSTSPLEESGKVEAASAIENDDTSADSNAESPQNNDG